MNTGTFETPRENKIKTIDNKDTQITSKIYDNSMSLILVILAKFCKVDQSYVNAIIEIFLEHVSSHLECFNYIISFYRLYNTCPELKYVSKEYELYNNLFEVYKKIYVISYKFEVVSFEKSNKRILPFDKINDSKYLIANMKRNEFENDLGYLHEIKETTETKDEPSLGWPSPNKNPNNSSSLNLNVLPLNNVANIVKDLNTNNTGISSLHDRKYSTSSYQVTNINSKLTESNFKVVPTLKIPKNIIEQHFSLTR